MNKNYASTVVILGLIFILFIILGYESSEINSTFWTMFSGLFQAVAAIGTLAAVILSLHISNLDNSPKLDISIELISPTPGTSFIKVAAFNTGKIPIALKKDLFFSTQNGISHKIECPNDSDKMLANGDYTSKQIFCAFLNSLIENRNINKPIEIKIYLKDCSHRKYMSNSTIQIKEDNSICIHQF